eukprot:871469_1
MNGAANDSPTLPQNGTKYPQYQSPTNSQNAQADEDKHDALGLFSLCFCCWCCAAAADSCKPWYQCAFKQISNRQGEMVAIYSSHTSHFHILCFVHFYYSTTSMRVPVQSHRSKISPLIAKRVSIHRSLPS